MRTQTRLIALFNRFIRDKHGRVVIWQLPNVPLTGWIVCIIAEHIISAASLKTNLNVISTAFLFTWAYLEVREGVSGFRRVLGCVVLLYIIMSLLLK